MWSEYPVSKEYTACLGYIAMFLEVKEKENKQWWIKVCYIKVPLKIRLFMWLTLSNKVLTWEVLTKRSWKGSSICPLCKNNSERIFHLVIGCHCSKEVWSAAKTMIGGCSVWDGDSTENALKT